MSEPETTIGQVIDSLGVTPNHKEGDLITDVVVVSKVVERDGSERLSIAWSDGLSFITRAGMLHHALLLEREDA